MIYSFFSTLDNDKECDWHDGESNLVLCSHVNYFVSAILQNLLAIYTIHEFRQFYQSIKVHPFLDAFRILLSLLFLY